MMTTRRLLALMVGHLAQAIMPTNRGRPALAIRGGAIAVILAALTATGTAHAQPQSVWQDFDCQGLIRQIQPPGLQFDMDVVLELIVPPGSAIPEGADPISVNEILGPGAPLLMRSRSEILNSEGAIYISCVLIIVEFIENYSYETMELAEENSHHSWEETPILLVKITDNPTEPAISFMDWEESNYNIPFMFPRFGDEYTALITPDTVVSNPFLENWEWDQETVRFIRFQPLPNGVKAFLGENGAGDAGAMMVLCERYACHEIADTVRAATPREPQPPPITEDTGTSDCEPEPAGAIGTCRVTTLAFGAADGRESTASLDVVGDLGCIFSAIDPSIFETPPACDATAAGHMAREELAVLNPVIRIAEDGRWLIVAGPSDGDTERDPDPLRVEVSLPEGQPAASCRLDLEYTAADRQSVIVALEPLAGRHPARFSAVLHAPPRRYGNNVHFRIRVSSAAACGGPTREVLVSAPQVIEVPLVPGERVLRAVAHILPVDRERLEIDLGMDEAERLAFVRAVLGALEAAHAQLAATHADRAWPLVSANVSRLRADGALEELTFLNAWTLRQPTTEGFDGIESEVGALMDNTATLTAQRLVDALSPLLEDAAHLGIDHLTIMLIAPVPQRPGRRLTHPCSDRRYRDLGADLAAIGGPEVDVVVFPLVGLFDEDQPDLSDLVPLGFDPAAPTLPGGLYACRDTPPGTDIYPFFVEPWRARVSIAPRYATALSDQLAAVLASLITEGEPIR